MKLFGQIVGAVTEVVKLPADVAIDVVMAFPDLCEDEKPGHRTAERLDKIKDAAKES